LPPITGTVKVPRAAATKFPRGATVGEPGARERQRQVVLDALKLLETAEEPGEIVELPYRWKRDDG
jgi:D-proline reductase (dithiol) PrdB